MQKENPEEEKKNLTESLVNIFRWLRSLSSINMKRIAVLSDIHGNIAALEAVVNDIKRKNIDHIVNLGDHISGPLWPEETIRYLMKQDWIHILGNHDRNLISQDPHDHRLSDQYSFKSIGKNEKDWLKSLPKNIEAQEGLFLFHGTPFNDEIYLLETIENGRARLATHAEISDRLSATYYKQLACGHSHIQRVVELPGSIIIVNPGSVGLPAYDDTLPEYHIMESGSSHARYSIIDYQNSLPSVDMISVSYDYKIAVKQALKNDRPDWAKGLESGYMVD